MKRLINIFIGLATVVLMTAACKKEAPQEVKQIDQNLVGEWHLEEATAEGTDIYKNIDVYLKINSDSSFELYQKSGTQAIRYEKYTGTCDSDNGILTGLYSDGKEWNKYIYLVSGNNLNLKSYNLIEEHKYVKKEIPADVKDNADIMTKSDASETAPIL